MSEYVSNIETTDGIKKIKDAEGRELIENNSQLIRRLQNTPLPAYTISDMTRTDRVYVLLDQTSPDYGYIFYYDEDSNAWVRGWEYQTFETGSYGGNFCFISMPSRGVIVEGETVTLDMTVYAMQHRHIINYETERVAVGGNIKYIWVADDDSIIENRSPVPPAPNYALIMYHSRNTFVPCTPCNIIVDGITWNQSPVKENNSLWINAESEGFTLSKNQDDTYNIKITLTCVAFQRRINLDTNITTQPDTFTYIFVNASGNIITTDSIATPPNYALLAYTLNRRIVPASPCDVTYIYEQSDNSITYPASSISAGLNAFAHADPVTGINDRNYIDMEKGKLYIDFLRIWTTNKILVTLRDVTFNFTSNSGFHIIHYDTYTGELVESSTSNLNSERWVWICTAIPNMNYFVAQFKNIRLISKQTGYYSASQRIGLFGDSIMTGTASTNISVNLKTMLGIEGYNGAVGGSGFLKGWCQSDGGIDEVQETTGSTHSSGQFNLKSGIEVEYPARTSFDIGTRIFANIENMSDLKISHIYIHNGNNDCLSGSQNIADFWDNFDPQNDYEWTHNVLANRIVEIVLKLKQYNIDTTIMLPVGRQFTDSQGNYTNNATYNKRRKQYIKILEKLSEQYEIDLIRTDKLFQACVPYDSGLTLSPQTTSVPKFLSDDNLHPTTWGYTKMACTIANHYYNYNKVVQFNFY